MQTTKCPLCNSDLLIGDDSYEGDIMDCPSCEKELEISSLHPLRVSATQDEEELDEGDPLDE